MKKYLWLATILCMLCVAFSADAAPRIKYSGVASDRYGNIVASATVSVYLAGTTTPAKCYTTEVSATAVYSVTSASDGTYSFWVDSADYGYVQRYKTVTAKTGFTSKTNDDIFTAFFPTSAVGYLYNDGTGVFSWAAAAGGDSLPADAVGYLYNDGAGAISWATPPGTGDMLLAVYDVAANNKIDADKIDDLDAAIIASGQFDAARIPDLSATYDAAGTGAAAVTTHETTYDHTTFLSSVAETNFNFADITTGDVSQTLHGLVPKQPSNAYQFFGSRGWANLSLASAQFTGQGYNAADYYYLAGAATAGSAPTWGRLEDIKLFMTVGSTVNDASITTHGFLPILANDVSKCLSGIGTWVACGGVDLTAPGPIGSVTPSTGAFTTLTADSIAVNRTDNPNIYRWYEATSDGDNYKDFIAPAKGTGFAANRTHTLGDYNSSDVLSTSVSATGYVHNTQPLEVDGHAAANLSAAQVSGTTIYNTGQDADTYLTLPTAAASYQALFTVGTTVAKYWGVCTNPAVTDKIYLIAADGTIAAGADDGCVRLATAQIGQAFACWTIKTDAWDWSCKAVAIGTSTFAVP